MRRNAPKWLVKKPPESAKQGNAKKWREMAQNERVKTPQNAAKCPKMTRWTHPESQQNAPKWLGRENPKSARWKCPKSGRNSPKTGPWNSPKCRETPQKDVGKSGLNTLQKGGKCPKTEPNRLGTPKLLRKGKIPPKIPPVPPKFGGGGTLPPAGPKFCPFRAEPAHPKPAPLGLFY